MYENITFKKHNNVTGIYELYWPCSGRYYYGQSINIYSRVGQHKSELNRGVHGNDILQKCFNKYGMPLFFCVIKCEKSLLNDLEQLFIAIHYKNPMNCNISSAPENRVISDSMKINMSLARDGVVLSESHRNNISIGLKSAYENGRSKPDLNGIKNPFFNKKHSQKSKDAMSASKKVIFMGDKNPNSRILFDNINGIFYTTKSELAALNNLAFKTFYYRLKSGNYYKNIIQV